MGITGPDGIWSEEYAEACDLGLLTALDNPDVTLEQLVRATEWDTWTFRRLHRARLRQTRRPRRLEGLAARQRALMPLAGASTTVPVNGVERAPATLWARTAPTLTLQLRRRMRELCAAFAERHQWEVANAVHRRIPDPVDFLEMRRETAAGDLTAILLLASSGHDLPPEVDDHPHDGPAHGSLHRPVRPAQRHLLLPQGP
ncbi:hypothetical protein HII36_37190 [Nonomuraea sp. NN258]|uniref:terpene synthase family protein n=1 Tax=Nonomuraea antri TaxID=2730852 RepID=UPI0015686482|nr:terpene synthase family protein [Nonomuraea antri]NRQ37429.1 hypothetical protein [Nonomuraea antri]